MHSTPPRGPAPRFCGICLWPQDSSGAFSHHQSLSRESTQPSSSHSSSPEHTGPSQGAPSLRAVSPGTGPPPRAHLTEDRDSSFSCRAAGPSVASPDMHVHGQIVAGFQVGQWVASALQCHVTLGAPHGGGVNGSHLPFQQRGHTALVLRETAGPTEGIHGHYWSHQSWRQQSANCSPRSASHGSPTGPEETSCPNHHADAAPHLLHVIWSQNLCRHTHT